MGSESTDKAESESVVGEREAEIAQLRGPSFEVAALAGWLKCAPTIGAVADAISALAVEVPYRPGLPPEPQRRSVALWQVRRRDCGAGWGTDPQPFMLWFTVEERRLPREAAHTCAYGVLALNSDVWEQFECRPCRASGTPCPWTD